MSQIVVRQLPPEVHRALKARARSENRSAEAVARDILRSGLLPEESTGFGQRMASLWSDADLTDVDLDPERAPYDPPDLS